MASSDRFSVSRVNDRDSRDRREMAVDVSRNANTVPTSPDRRPSFNQLTREALPRLDNYRLSKRALKRPSLGTLHGDLERSEDLSPDDAPQQHSHFKLGWIQGVLIPCLLNIYGVMLFLRMGWIVGQAGVFEALLIIGISALVCVITALSLSAICTNGEVKGGGIYYIISRSLGPEFGASVGVVFAVANAVAASMNTIGFCDSLNGLLKSYGLKIIDGGVNDTRIIGCVALFIMICVCAVGMEWEVKAQNFLIVIIVAAMFDFMIGTIMGPKTDEAKSKGFVGFSTEVLQKNLYSDYRHSEGLDQNFFTVLGIFFPSVTGIQAGANICGDLKDPAGSIPKGTLLSLLFSMTTYCVFVLFAGGAALRDASGMVGDVVNGTVAFGCAANNTCEFGLEKDYAIMQLMSVWGWLIYAGCFAATLSTALTNLLSVPRLIQALGIDRIYPGVIFFSKGYGKNQEPYRGYVLTFIVSACFLLIADLNTIAPLISNFYLAAYALINFCTFHAAFVKPLGWRPSFKFYSAWLSLFGSILCVVIMFFLSWTSSLITIAIIFALYLVVVYRKPDANWGSSTQEQTYKTALSAAYRLQNVGDHIKNYHPQVLVLAGGLHNRPPLIDLGNLITKNNSLLIIGDIIEGKISYRARQEITREANKYLEAKKIKAFYNLIDDINFENGVRMLMNSSGFGKLSPNIALMGYKADWQSCNYSVLNSYFNILHNAFDYRVAIAILRLPNGLDYSFLKPEYIPAAPYQNIATCYDNPIAMSNDNLSVKPSKLMHVDSNLNLEAMDHSNGNSNSNSFTTPQRAPLPNQRKLALSQSHNDIVYATRGGSTVSKEVLASMNIFDAKQPKGTIDIWWLYDDGGLTVLLPYILSTRSTWSNCKIRVFALTNRKQEAEVEERNMANLLSKLRIDYTSLVMLQGVSDRPKDSTIKMHNRLLEGFLEGQNTECFISNSERMQLEEKTHRQLRLREMLIEHSSKASLIVMSLPMPRQGSVSAPLYMSWLEMLTREMPPFLLVRGNQSSVLTFYS